MRFAVGLYNPTAMITPPRLASRLRPIHLLWLIVPLLLGWALRNIRLADVADALGRLGPGQIAILIGINALTLLSFTGRWWLILRAQGYVVPYLILTGYRVAAFGVSYFTPGPQIGGEPLLVYLPQRHHNVPGPAAAAAAALDKTLELLVNFAVLAVGLLWMTEGRVLPELANIGVIGGILILLALPAGFLAAAWRGWQPLTSLMRRLPVRDAQSPAYRRVYSAVADSERQVTQFCRAQPWTLIVALLISILSWGLILIEYWLSMSFLGLNLTLIQLVTAVTINRIAFLAPLPGGLGALESGQVLAMTTLGLNPAIGISQGLIIRARDVLVGGLGVWWGVRAAASGQKSART